MAYLNSYVWHFMPSFEVNVIIRLSMEIVTDELKKSLLAKNNYTLFVIQ
jgi:hypothetical protein